MNSIQQEILNKLQSTEATHDVKIIHAIESGSRGWGFAAKDADYDCRFIYVRPQDWYLSVQARTEFIEYAVDEVFDIRGYDISRVLKYIARPDIAVYEWLSSNEIYIRNNALVSQLQALTVAYFNPVPTSWHYLKLAERMYDAVASTDQAKIKKYYYILRPIANLNYIWQHRKMPHMEYTRTIAEIEMPSDVLSAIQGLTQIKQAAHEHDTIEKQELLLSYFKAEIAKAHDRLSTMQQTKNRDYEQIDTVFRNIIKEAWS